ncbi:hypothetical protein [Lysinibacillus fusiformis]|uniref:Uncharacterized protein n=1 Tax=Lysinibacillus fusiformis TaxID=28031 RepID=A0A1H9HAY5_9BACI|nr:hypothetical protein [Lysinibacillus fusiformis]SCY30300.1 hypothetical protein SAMN02787081_01957 [Lysinibacillus fusiformis]SEN53488.1 hypothetical protein SAMN02787103_02064 [Lysinibacillus fusiformis]SEQ59480.1 hypothetical protein SAMN02787113_01970 [Lysinibacillus fusiformis]
MNITLSTLDRKLVVTFPIIPVDMEWSRSTKSSVLSTLKQDIDMMENHELRKLNIKSFFPDNGRIAGKKYSFQKDKTSGRRIVEILNWWQDQKTALRLVVTAKDGRTLVNHGVKIIEFAKGLDKVSDYTYTLVLQEHIVLRGI